MINLYPRKEVIRMTLREKVIEFLDVMGMTKVKFARLSSVHPSTFNLWINKNGEITSDNIKRIEICLEMQKIKIGEYLAQSK
jgi:plasmid maintenance system antidote protein VapI